MEFNETQKDILIELLAKEVESLRLDNSLLKYENRRLKSELEAIKEGKNEQPV